MAHNFKQFPELTNTQMAIYYFDSPHRQIVDNFNAKVERITDGDTIQVSCDFRDFKFPIRFSFIDAPELKTEGGQESKSWLESMILGEEVEVHINPKNRVEKWGRLLGEIMLMGISVNKMSLEMGFSVPFEKKESVWE